MPHFNSGVEENQMNTSELSAGSVVYMRPDGEERTIIETFYISGGILAYHILTPDGTGYICDDSAFSTTPLSDPASVDMNKLYSILNIANHQGDHI